MNRKEVAKETVDILKSGQYIYDGRSVNIEELHRNSIEGSKTVTPEAGKRLLESGIPETMSGNEKAVISLENQGAVEAILKLKEQGRRLGVLNFASAKNPGGGFLNGAMAQEESLAASGGLYDTLLANPEYYEKNRACGTMMYTDYAIFSPEVVFFRDVGFSLIAEPVTASVLTLPAVNMGQVILKNEDVTEAKRVMRRRMELCLRIFAEEKMDDIILGAYGCGVFRNAPAEVAGWWKELLEEGYIHCFRRVHFAVLDTSAKKSCYEAFRETFSF